MTEQLVPTHPTLVCQHKVKWHSNWSMLAFKDNATGWTEGNHKEMGCECAHCFMENHTPFLKLFQSLERGTQWAQDLWDPNASHFSVGSRKSVSCSTVSTVFIRLLVSGLLLPVCITTDCTCWPCWPTASLGSFKRRHFLVAPAPWSWTSMTVCSFKANPEPFKWLSGGGGEAEPQPDLAKQVSVSLPKRRRSAIRYERANLCN